MVENIISSAILGFIGGAARASVGLLKALRRKEKFKPLYFTVSILTAGLVGIFTGLVYGGDYKVTLIVGYAGTDIIEGLYKMKNPKSTLFS